MTRHARICFLALAILLVTASAAYAQGPVYKASSPTPGALYTDGQSGRYLLGGAWLFRADLSDVGLSQRWYANVAATDGWSPTTVPNAYNAGNFTQASMNGYVGWYRRDFTIPVGAFAKYVSAADRHWIIRFESVNYGATVWLNGRKIGSHNGAYLPWELDLTGLHAGVNRLIVRVDNRRSKFDLPPGPGGGWFNYGGITREVYLRAVQRADITQVQVRPILRCPTCSATIEEQAVIRNVSAKRQTVRLRGVYGSAKLDFGTASIAPHATWTATASTVIAHPRLWSLGHGVLYRATLTLSDTKGNRLGSYVDLSGIRSFTVVNGHLMLNGRPLNVRGFSIHEQDLQLGSALNPAAMRAMVGWIRELGATVIRAHYPLNPEIEEMADRYGLVIWSEIPVYQVQNQYLNYAPWVANAHAVLKANILANQNHPSVMVWSIGNELPTPATTAESKYIADLELARRRLPEGIRAAGRDRRQRVFRLVRRRRRRRRRPRRAGPVPGLRTPVLSDQGADGHRVRVRRKPRRAGGGARHVRLPGQHDRLPPRRVRDQALSVGRDVLRASGLRRVPHLQRRRSAAEPAV
jgi:beta-glucuronidase